MGRRDSNSLSEILKLMIVSSEYDVDWLLRVLRLIGDVLPASIEDLKREAIQRGLISEDKRLSAVKKVYRDYHIEHVVKGLVERGILRRGRRVKDYELVVPRDTFMNEIEKLESYLSDKAIVWEGSVPRRRGTGSMERYFFIRKGEKLIRLRRLSEIIRGGVCDYLIVLKESIDDLILLVEFEDFHSRTETGKYEWHRGMRLCWLNPELVANKNFKNMELDYYGDKENIVWASPRELLNYRVDPEDRVGVDIRLPFSSFEIADIRKLDGVLFEVKGDVQKHSWVCGMLEKVGRALGYRAEREVEMGAGRVDVVWFEENNPLFAFEVVIAGSIKEALYRLSRINAKKRYLVVENDRLDEARRQAPSDVRVIPVSTVEAMETSMEGLPLLKEFIKKE